ncbi:MAG: tetratricopeptide repeat protein [Leptospirales bacterium]
MLKNIKNTFFFSLLILALNPFSLSAAYNTEDLESSEVLQSLTLKAIQFYHQKKYDQTALIMDRILKVYPDDKTAYEYYIKANDQLIRALILGKQAVILVNNGQLLEAQARIEEAGRIAPHSPAINKLAEYIKNKSEDLKPLSHLDEQQRKSFEILLKKATKELNEGRNEEALLLFRDALKIAPESPRAVRGYNLALLRSRSENYSEQTKRLFQKADAFRKAIQYIKAKGVYEEILAYDPANIRAETGLKEMEKLIAELSQAAEKSQLAQQYYDEARDHLDGKEFENAIEKYELGKATLAPYKNWDQLIINAKKQKKDFENKDRAEKSAMLDKSLNNAFVLITTERYKEAVKELNTVVIISKELELETFETQAIELLKKTQESMRKQEDETITIIHPYYDAINTQKILGLEAYKRKKYKLAQEYFSSILELFPKNRFANIYNIKCTIELGIGSKTQVMNDLISGINVNLKSGDKFEAKRLYNIAKEIEPGNAELKALSPKFDKKRIINDLLNRDESITDTQIENMYKNALNLSRSKPKESIAVLNRIVKADPANTKARKLLLQLQNIAKSRSSTYEAPRINSRAQQYYADGIRHYNNGRIRDARSSFIKALRIEPSYTKARKAREKCDKYLGIK